MISGELELSERNRSSLSLYFFIGNGVIDADGDLRGNAQEEVQIALV